MKSDYLNDQYLLETEQEQDFWKKMQDQLLFINEIPAIGNFDAYAKLAQHDLLSLVMPYISSDFEVFKLYLATHVEKCTKSASMAGLPANITEMLKKDAFAKITKAKNQKELENIMLHLLDELKREYRRNNVRKYSHTIQRAIEFIHNHKHQPLTAADVTAHLGVERTHLSRQFHQETGLTITDYIHRVKMDAAEALILGRGYSLTEIADLLGYSSYSYFSRVYKKYKHCLPGETSRQVTASSSALG